MKVITACLCAALSCAPSLGFVARPARTTHHSVLAAPLASLKIKSDFDVAEYVQSFDPSSITDNLDIVRQNTMEGEVGSRGEVYVALQAVVLLAILVGSVPVIGDALMMFLGPALMVGGLGTCVFSVTDLGKSLSPWPTTTSTTELTTDGLFSQVRHPIYAGLLAVSAGLAIVTGSAVRLLLVAVLLYILDVKSDFEEEELVKKFPDDYPVYQKQVTNKFVPQSLTELLPWTKS
jgi:protein-S-isoprenylcysteine O-methyltransferase Ste14